MTIKQTLEIKMTDQTKRAIVACGDKAGLGKRIARTMDRENELTINRVQQKLTGEVLHVQTGLLRKSIGRTQAVVVEDQIFSSVGSGATFGKASVAYAAFWEFGFTGTETIGAHIRKHKSRQSFSFGGKSVSRKVRGADIEVKSHQRKVNQAPRSYIGSTIADRQANYAASLEKTVLEYLGGTFGGGA